MAGTTVVYLVHRDRQRICRVTSSTVEPVLKGHTNVVSEDRWSLVAGSITLRYRTWQE